LAGASDHLDSASVVADPSLDIGDLYAWISPAQDRLELAMTLVGQRFSPHAQYVFHIASGREYGETGASHEIRCRIRAAEDAECVLDRGEQARGDARSPHGILSSTRKFRMFAGPRNDPFFNNVSGTRAAYQVAKAAIDAGRPTGAAGCPALEIGTVSQVLYQWRHTQEKAATNFLAGWNASAIILSIDLQAVSQGGSILAVWASTREKADRSTGWGGR